MSKRFAPFKKQEQSVPRSTFRAWLVIDPQNLVATQLQPVEGQLQLTELTIALGALRDQCLLQIGALNEKQRAPQATQQVSE